MRCQIDDRPALTWIFSKAIDRSEPGLSPFERSKRVDSKSCIIFREMSFLTGNMSKIKCTIGRPHVSATSKSSKNQFSKKIDLQGFLGLILSAESNGVCRIGVSENVRDFMNLSPPH